MMVGSGAPKMHAARPAVRSILFAATLLSLSFSAAPAFAQGAGCGDVQPMLVQRKSIGDRISAATKGKNIDAKRACTDFGALVSNGDKLLKWTEANKDWCQVPDQFIQSIKEDHGRAVQIRRQACGAAAKQAQMEKQAREGGGGGLLGGGGLTGPSRMPQGAL